MSNPAGVLLEHSHKTVSKRLHDATLAPLNSLQPPSPGALLQRAALAPESLRPADLLRLQQTVGNRAVGGFLGRPSGQRPVMQAKLTVNAPGDEYEQEADRMAEQVMRMPAVQREELEGEDETHEIMSKREPAHAAGGAFEAGEEFEQQLRATQGRGRPLPHNLREEFETKFGADFRGVRIHTGALADRLNHSMQAQAFTAGQDVYFRHGTYDPGNRSGQAVIAHELTHVVQQSGRQVQRRSEGERGRNPRALTLGPDLEAQPGIKISRNAFTVPRIQRTVQTAAVALYKAGKIEVEDTDLSATFLNTHGVTVANALAIRNEFNKLREAAKSTASELYKSGKKELKLSHLKASVLKKQGFPPNYKATQEDVIAIKKELDELWEAQKMRQATLERQEADAEAAQGVESMEEGVGGDMDKMQNDASPIVDALIDKFNVTSITQAEAAVKKDYIVTVNVNRQRIDRQGPSRNATHAKFAVQIGKATYAGIEMPHGVTFTIEHVRAAFRYSLETGKYIRIFRRA